MSLLLVWRHKIISFLSKQLLLQSLMKNYVFNTFSSPGHGLKLQKCVFKVWWRHKLSFAITWRQNVISFDQEFVFITLLCVQGIDTNFRGSETSQWCHQTLDQKYGWVQAVFYSLTHREQYSVVKPVVCINWG